MNPKPTPKQLDFLNWEIGMFFHFGIRAFFPGHSDWDGKPMPASAFNPTELDCYQWIRVAKSMGAKYAILTCKHHDGFANWPSKYSDYSVAQTPWQDGKGDVVDMFCKACRRYDVKVGLYYSPAQWGGKVSFKEDKDYDDYFINQISELLTNYGKIDYLWFDGCGSEGHEYNKPRIIKTIRDLQPDILIFEMWDPDTRWIGNEEGIAHMPNNNVRNSMQFSVNTTEAVALEHACFLPGECDMEMRSTWFDCEANEDTIKSLDELVGLYQYSVGRGANLLLNIGPDHRGLIPEKDAQRAKEFGEAIRRMYECPIPFSPVQETEKGWQIDLEDNRMVNTVVIEEDLTDGEAVQEFRVMARMPRPNQYFCVYQGKTIGHKAICLFPATLTRSLYVEILKADGTVKLKSVKAYYNK